MPEYSVGIDIGSRTTKAVVWDGMEIKQTAIVSTGWNPSEAATTVFNNLCNYSNLDSSTPVFACGFARAQAAAAQRTVTEITAHAKGIASQLKGVRTVIDVGGQDMKVILIDDEGLVVDFAMNDRCAAGSGRFLEYLALTLGLSIQEFSEMGLHGSEPARLSSICTVFAETEMLSLLAEGIGREEVARGLHLSIARRIIQLAAPLKPMAPFAITGGGAHNRCLVRELEDLTGHIFQIPSNPVFTGAAGCAILAWNES